MSTRIKYDPNLNPPFVILTSMPETMERMMHDLTAEGWADGLGLYEDRWAFATVAPRDHAEWWFDVAAIMRGETADPWGWASLDPYEEDVDREVETFAWIEPPTHPADVARFRHSVDELPRSSVTSLMVLLAIVGMDASKTWNFDERQPEMERRAQLLLSRFPVGTRFYSNIGWDGEAPNFYEQPVNATNPFSRSRWDAGLLAVNDTEVALIWTFESF
ncbi:hypothetical protein [Streptomyces virginiae]|uniref:hypothetical protein n=1 Tax=Streptomyces virginiae TaxID=1961 RepID=UPI00324ED06B